MSEKILDPRIDAMFQAGAHFGYSKTRRHPSTAASIFATKNKNDLINLEKTIVELDTALEYIKSLAPLGKTILFVGVKPEARDAIKNAGMALDMPYVTERWIGGTLTNFPEIKKRIARLEDLKAKKEAGELDVYTKKERLLLDREVNKLTLYFGGLTTLKKTPDVIVIVDPKKEHIAFTEAQKAHVPVIALANTDCDIREVDYPIIANDGSVSSVNYFINEVVEAYKSGRTIQA
jgi:small subunit ribosomal protein S2